jgi:hypothetical protein
MSNGFDKMSLSGPGVTHLDLAAHGTVSLSRCNINNQARYTINNQARYISDSQARYISDNQARYTINN